VTGLPQTLGEQDRPLGRILDDHDPHVDNPPLTGASLNDTPLPEVIG
jgi:hypothetical protein